MNIRDSLSELHSDKNGLMILSNGDVRRYKLRVAGWYNIVNMTLCMISESNSRIKRELNGRMNIHIPLSETHPSTIFRDYETCNRKKYSNVYRTVEGNAEYPNQIKISDNLNRRRVMFFKDMG